jgi:hypothetical protein
VQRSRIFLSVAGAVFTVIFAIPLFVDPVWWAERFGWDTDGPRDLVVYFGRCLGAVALGLTLLALRAVRDPAAHVWLFDLLALVGVLLAIVHLRGAIEDAQPLIEHLETAGYAAFAGAALICRPQAVAA